MLKWKNVVGLSESEEVVAGLVEGHIDTSIQEQVDADPNRRSFTVNRAEMVKASGEEVLTLKVKSNVLDKYRKDGWDITETDDEIAFSAPMPKRGGRPKGKKNAPKTPDTAAALAGLTPPAETPAETVTA